MPEDTFTLKIIALYISKAPGPDGSVPVPEITFRSNYGIVGDYHVGEERVRSTGEIVPNVRQFTAVHPHELGEVAERLGIPFIDPAWLKANICFACRELENFTEALVPGTKLIDAQGNAVLEIKGITEPCLDAGGYIAAQMPHLAVNPQIFPKVAYGRRGVYGIALENVTIKLHDTFTVNIA